MNNIHFSSNSDDYSTPQDLFDKYNAIYNFKLDACANKDNYKCDKYYTIENNGLLQPWINTTFCNPPYSQVKFWIKKGYEEQQNGITSVLLIPARTDTIAWHKYIFNNLSCSIVFLQGRLKFNNLKNSAPFPSAIIIFNGN